MRAQSFRYVFLGLAALILMPALLTGLMWPSAAPAVEQGSVDLTQTPLPTGAVHLPMISRGATPTVQPTPTRTPFSASAALYITPFQPINASTFNTGSFVLENLSRGDERIRQVRIDLSTAVFLDMVFDPFGVAGDTVAKNLTIDARSGLIFQGHRFDGPNSGGYTVLEMDFASFDPGDSIRFSIDVDPTSIKGSSAPGPGESGSVGGLELVGATVTVAFETGPVLTNQVYRLADAGKPGGGLVLLRDAIPPRPQLVVVGASAPGIVDRAQQTARIGGPVGQPVQVLVIEGALFAAGLPGGGHDIDPFEANNALTLREYSARIGPGGTVDVPILLSRSHPNGGLNIITAVFDDHYGLKGLTASPLILELP